MKDISATPGATLTAPRESHPVPLSGSLGWFPTWIMGRRYYNPVPPSDVALDCERDPDNPNDPDAIAVYAPHNRKVGYLPRYDAAYLSPLLDRGVIRLAARLAGDDDPQNRTPIRLEVGSDINVETLAGPGAFNVAAIWHTQLMSVWRNRSRFAYDALDEYRAGIRALAHSGRLWPETQLFYRLLKGVVADGIAAKEQACLCAARLAAEKKEKQRAEETSAIRAVFACEPCGALLPFGQLSILPLRILRPAPVMPLAEALRTGAAALTLKKNQAAATAFRLLTADGIRVLAVAGERLDTTAGVFWVAHDTVFEHGAKSSVLHTLAAGDAFERPIPVFLNHAATAEPPLPSLPSEATGFAVFHGGECRELFLYAHPVCAVAAHDKLRRMAWHLRSSTPAPSDADAFLAVSSILGTAPFANTPPFIRFDAAGFTGKAMLLDGAALCYLHLSSR